ncbi:MAG: citrate synthase [Candidatus Micrarchaeales archaeon]|nr:citrate synthase [Candidatus Micrarchaeales archaeon]
MANGKLPPGFKKGLEGVIAGESKICKVDGEKGKLYYRGYSIEDLAVNCTFDEVTYLLLEGKLPNRGELAKFTEELSSMRELPAYVVEILEEVAHKTTPMEALRTAVSSLAGGDKDVEGITTDYHLAQGKSMVAKFATIVAYYNRINNKMKIVKPDPSLGHAANFLYMVTGKRPSEIEAKAMDQDLVLHAEHSFNASTFAARITVSTLSDMYSAMTTGIGVLKGPLHGGASEAVMGQLQAIGSVENVEPYIKDTLSKHQKMMGIGHRVYKVYDPRAKILKKTAERFSKAMGDMKWYDIADKIEQVMFREKKLYPNVDFFSSIIYKGLGLPLELDSPIFAISRVSGWSAHALEQYEDNRLIRPIDYYTGPVDLKFIPIEKRK